MQSEYRGHRIHLVASNPWLAEFMELASGTTLPTRLIAHPGESLRDFWARGRDLVDLYLEGPGEHRVLGPVRPWQTVFEPGMSAEA